MTTVLSRAFIKSLSRVSPKIEAAFYERLALFTKESNHPILNNHALHGKFSDKRSINVTGDYRALFKNSGDATIFTDIGTHPQLYG